MLRERQGNLEDRVTTEEGERIASPLLLEPFLHKLKLER